MKLIGASLLVLGAFAHGHGHHGDGPTKAGKDDGPMDGHHANTMHGLQDVCEGMNTYCPSSLFLLKADLWEPYAWTETFACLNAYIGAKISDLSPDEQAGQQACGSLATKTYPALVECAPEVLVKCPFYSKVPVIRCIDYNMRSIGLFDDPSDDRFSASCMLKIKEQWAPMAAENDIPSDYEPMAYDAVHMFKPPVSHPIERANPFVGLVLFCAGLCAFCICLLCLAYVRKSSGQRAAVAQGSFSRLETPTALPYTGQGYAPQTTLVAEPVGPSQLYEHHNVPMAQPVDESAPMAQPVHIHIQGSAPVMALPIK